MRILYFGGTIVPCDGNSWKKDALVTEGNKVIGTGTREDMCALAGAKARAINLDGATIMPGFVDTHPHVMHFGALEYGVVDLFDATCHDEIVARIRKQAEKTPAGQWIMTTPVGEPHYFIRRSYRDLVEGRMPDRHVLDRATKQHPVLIQPWAPKTPNICAFNSLGLEHMGLSRITPERVHNTWIDRDRQGELTGILRGSVNNYYTLDPFWLQLWSKLPLPEDDVWEKGAELGMKQAHAMGMTTAYEGHSIEVEHIRAYQKLRRENRLQLRVMNSLELANQPFRPHLHPRPDDVMEMLELARSLVDLGDDMLKINGITISRSGPCFPGFMNTWEPFADPYGNPTTGVVFLPRDYDRMVIDYCLKHDLRLNAVLGSLRDHEEFFETLDGFECDDAIRHRHWILQHCIQIAESHARRAAELNLSVTTCAGFSWGKGAMYAERIGRHIWRDLVPLQRLKDCGVTVGAGSDWGPKNIFEQIKLAQTFEFCGIDTCNPHPGHRVSREDAILMWTRDAARVMGWNGIGSLVPGNYADFTVLDDNPVECETDKLPKIQVLRTVVDGDVVYDNGTMAS